MSEGMLGNLPLSEVRGPRNDLDEKLASKQGPMWLRAFNKFLRRENPWGIPTIIEITTNGRSGEEFITDLEKQGYNVGDYAKQLLRGKDFIVCDGTTYKLAVISGDEFEDSERTNGNIRAEAAARGYLDPPMELAPYLREMFSHEDLKQMGVWALVLMLKPATDSDGGLRVLGVRRLGDGRWLHAYNARPDDGWSREADFLFLVPASS